MPCASTGLRALAECRDVLEPLAHQGLLAVASVGAAATDAIDDEELMAELAGAADGGITELRHVRASGEKRAAEEVAQRKKCEDFETFKPLFERVRRELDAGDRLIVPSRTSMRSRPPPSRRATSL